MELVILAAFALAAVIVIFIYNRLVTLRQTTKQAFANTDVQLKARADLIPNLVATVKAYAAHENETLVRLTQARSATQAATSTGASAVADNMMTMALGRLFAVAEAYPDLKANTNFLELQHELSDIENKIAASRRFLNSTVAEYNGSIEQFPAVFIARQFGFKAEEMYDVGTAQREAINVAPVVAF